MITLAIAAIIAVTGAGGASAAPPAIKVAASPTIVVGTVPLRRSRQSLCLINPLRTSIDVNGGKVLGARLHLSGRDAAGKHSERIVVMRLSRPSRDNLLTGRYCVPATVGAGTDRITFDRIAPDANQDRAVIDGHSDLTAIAGNSREFRASRFYGGRSGPAFRSWPKLSFGRSYRAAPSSRGALRRYEAEYARQAQRGQAKPRTASGERSAPDIGRSLLRLFQSEFMSYQQIEVASKRRSQISIPGVVPRFTTIIISVPADVIDRIVVATSGGRRYLRECVSRTDEAGTLHFSCD